MAAAVRIAIIGGGIVGLAAAVSLQDAGATVRLFEKGEPGQAQSVGLARIFRLAHRQPELVQLAMRARSGWQAWERRFGQQLLGQEGMLATGDETVHAYEQALRAAGAPCSRLHPDEALARLPIGHFPQAAVLFDPSAGSIRARRTINALCAALNSPIVRGEVHTIQVEEHGARITTETESWQCDRVLIAAGLHTPALAAQVGIEIPGEPWQIFRFSYEQRERAKGRPLACWIDSSKAYGEGLGAYALPIGTTGRYAVGVSREDDGHISLEVPRAMMRARALEFARTYVTAALPGLVPEPVDEVWCAGTSVDYPDEDGFRAYRSGPVVAVYGTNLFKFAPLLGELYAQAVLHDQSPPELMPDYLA